MQSGHIGADSKSWCAGPRRAAVAPVPACSNGNRALCKFCRSSHSGAEFILAAMTGMAINLAIWRDIRLSFIITSDGRHSEAGGGLVKTRCVSGASRFPR